MSHTLQLTNRHLFVKCRVIKNRYNTVEKAFRRILTKLALTTTNKQRNTNISISIPSNGTQWSVSRGA